MSKAAAFAEIIRRIDRGRASNRLDGLKTVRVADDPTKQGKSDVPCLHTYSLSGEMAKYGYGAGTIENSMVVEQVSFTFMLAVDRDRAFTNFADNSKPKGLIDWLDAIILEIETGDGEEEGELVADATLGGVLSDSIRFTIGEEEPTNVIVGCTLTVICPLFPRCRGVTVSP